MASPSCRRGRVSCFRSSGLPCSGSAVSRAAHRHVFLVAKNADARQGQRVIRVVLEVFVSPIPIREHLHRAQPRNREPHVTGMMPAPGELHDVVPGIGKIRLGQIGSHARIAEVCVVGGFDLESQGETFARVVLVAPRKHALGGRIQQDVIDRNGAAQVDLQPHRGVGVSHLFRAVGAIRGGRSRRHSHPAEIGSEGNVGVLGQRQRGLHGIRATISPAPARVVFVRKLRRVTVMIDQLRRQSATNNPMRDAFAL